MDFVKMDVEGFEVAVLDGGAGVFRTHRPAVIVELNRNTAEIYNGIHPRTLFEALRDIYSFVSVIEEGMPVVLRRVESYDEIASLLDKPNHRWVDLLCSVEAP